MLNLRNKKLRALGIGGGNKPGAFNSVDMPSACCFCFPVFSTGSEKGHCSMSETYLPPRQEELLFRIADQISKGHRPTIKELMAYMGVASPAAIQKLLRKLTEKGCIEKVGTAKRLGLTEEGGRLTGVAPVLRDQHHEEYTDSNLEDFPLPSVAEIERRKRAILARRGQFELV